MHVPDGFLDLATSVATGAVAAVGVVAALRGSRRELDDRTAPLAGLTAVFVFAGQMINFPVGAGTSGHLLVQALLFADGGLTALGTNITLMGLVGVWAGWAAFSLLSRVLPRRQRMVVPLAFVAGLVSVPAAALTSSVCMPPAARRGSTCRR